MKTLVRHGLAVCLALTTMCTSLLLVYSSLGGQKERPPQQQQQQEAAATLSSRRSAESSPPPRPETPAGPRPLDGYLGVVDHKASNTETRTSTQEQLFQALWMLKSTVSAELCSAMCPTPLTHLWEN